MCAKEFAKGGNFHCTHIFKEGTLPYSAYFSFEVMSFAVQVATKMIGTSEDAIPVGMLEVRWIGEFL